ncbi:retropepsin-like aspartic protease [Fulvivirga ligni]|uniref:retropepsin-like aspartic protease n=1 Tax=Fulvivirga ligni TaxID=2904246 RepID=UPI001F42D341|nr:retropepsin-like aspartic protease [Fulvivirga ligni]UII19926.1 retropepsin-like domain-containing protein [Fulvivirga ligni]
MKNLSYLLLTALLLLGCSTAEKPENIDPYLSGLLNKNDYFRLRDEVNKHGNLLPEDKRLYYLTHIKSAFFKGTESNEYADELLKSYGEKLNDSTLIELYNIKANNHLRAYEYEKAASSYSTILTKYSHGLDSAEIADYENSKALFGALNKVNAQKMHLNKNTTIPGKRNQFTHLMVPIRAGGINDEFIFDTGANLSTIARSIADTLGFKIIEASIQVGSSTEHMVQSELAVADTLYLGDILFENVVFLVLPDEQLSFPSINYEIHGIIGFPVIYQMGEVRLSNDGSIFIPAHPVKKELNNLFMSGLTPITKLITPDDTLLCNFDTGATSTDLSVQYYQRHKQNIEQVGELKKRQMGGAGGMTESEQYIIPDFKYTLGSKSGTIDSVAVHTMELKFMEGYDANIGQDIITQYDQLILNFKDMYIDFE